MKTLSIIIFLLCTFAAQSQSVYKTPSGSKYHLEECRMVNNVSQKLTISEAVEAGLQPCKICNPPAATTLGASTTNKAKGESNTVQCKGFTKAGKRCEHRTRIANGYCFQHDPDKKN